MHLLFRNFHIGHEPHDFPHALIATKYTWAFKSSELLVLIRPLSKPIRHPRLQATSCKTKKLVFREGNGLLLSRGKTGYSVPRPWVTDEPLSSPTLHPTVKPKKKRARSTCGRLSLHAPRSAILHRDSLPRAANRLPRLVEGRAPRLVPTDPLIQLHLRSDRTAVRTGGRGCSTAGAEAALFVQGRVLGPIAHKECGEHEDLIRMLNRTL